MDVQHRPSISSNDSSSFHDFGSDDSLLDVSYNQPEDVSSESDISTQNEITNKEITTTTNSPLRKKNANRILKNGVAVLSKSFEILAKSMKCGTRIKNFDLKEV